MLVYDSSGRCRLLHNLTALRLESDAGGKVLKLNLKDRMARSAERIEVNYCYGAFFSGYILTQKYTEKGASKSLEIIAQDELGRMHRSEVRPGILKDPSSVFIEKNYLAQFGFSIADDFRLKGEMNIPLGTSVFELMEMIADFYFGRSITILGKAISFSKPVRECEKLSILPDELSITEDSSGLCSEVYIFDSESDRFVSACEGEGTVDLIRYFACAADVPDEALVRKRTIKAVYIGRIVLPETGSVICLKGRKFTVEKFSFSCDESGTESVIEGNEIAGSASADD